jgi:poly-beta-1,6-N-acetyl-D-glucosamine synthase
VAAGIAAREPRVRVLSSPAAEGKAGALNRGVAAAAQEIVVFADARQRFAPGAVRALVDAFRDPAVGAASGRLVVGAAAGAVGAVGGVRAYWGLESRLRWAESRTGSVVGVTGAIHAVRRRAFEPLPPGVILDDVLLPMRVARRGLRVVVAPDAVAFDVPAGGAREEYRRKRRTTAGNVQLLRLAPWLLSPRANPLFIRWLSHKLLRLASPVSFAGATAVAAALPGAGYRAFFVAMAALYLYGAAGLAVRLPFSGVPAAFVLMHGAVLAALRRSREDAATLWVPSAGAVRP